MKRMLIRSNDVFTVTRFDQRTKAERQAAWLAYRNLGVGGSDMSTIIGLNPYSTPYTLWLEKTGRAVPEDISDRWAIIRGNTLEVELRRRFRRLHPEWQVTDGTDISLTSVAHPIMHASLDGFIYDPDTGSWGILEIKTANANRGRHDWHDADGQLVIPPYYAAQVTHYMAVTGFTWGVVYADIGESEPVEIRFERDEEDVEAVIAAAESFWGFVTRDEMPALVGGDVEKAWPTPDADDIVDMTGRTDVETAIRDYITAKDAESVAKAAKSDAQNRLQVLIGEHAGLTAGGYRATFKHQHRDGYVREVKPSDFRTFRINRVKERTR